MDILLNKQLEILKDIGLNTTEANVYIASITLGPSSVIQLSQKSGYVRQVVYEVLPKLIETGLMKKIKLGKKQRFQATKLESLKDRVVEISEKIDDLIPVLKTRQATNKAIPEVTVYENPIAMREWYRKMLAEAKKGDEFLVWSAGKLWINMDRKFYYKFIDKMQEIGTINKIITASSEDAINNSKEIGVANVEYRADDLWNRDGAEMWVWKNEVCFLSIRESATNMIVIESEDVAAMERYNFHKAWNSLEKGKTYKKSKPLGK